MNPSIAYKVRLVPNLSAAVFRSNEVDEEASRLVLDFFPIHIEIPAPSY